MEEYTIRFVAPSVDAVRVVDRKMLALDLKVPKILIRLPTFELHEDSLISFKLYKAYLSPQAIADLVDS